MATKKLSKQEQNVAAMQARLEQAQKDIAYLKSVNKAFKKIEKNKKALTGYYYKEWMKDYEKSGEMQQHYQILNQDSLFEAIQDLYYEKLALLKSITKDL